MPSHNRHLLARLFIVTCTLAVAVALAVTVIPEPQHPPHVQAAAAANPSTPINPTAVSLPDIDAWATGLTTTTTTAPPPPPVRTAPSPVDVAVPVSEIEQIIARWFGPLYGQARKVAFCESTLNPSAVAGPNFGLFQINRVHAADFAAVTGVPFEQGWSDPNLNSQYAAHLHAEQGWGPWACHP